MPIPAILGGAAIRAIAGGAARSIPAATGAASAPLTRRAVREAQGSSFGRGGLVKDSLAAFGGFSAVSSITSQAQGPLQNAVGYAIQQHDMENNLAMSGLQHSMHAHTQLAIPEAAKGLPPTVDGYDDSDVPAIEQGGLGFSARVLGLSSRDKQHVRKVWEREGYVTNRGINVAPTNMNVMSSYSRYQVADASFEARGIPPEGRAALAQAFARGVNVVDNLSLIGSSSNGYTG